jgi:hypothetical protein
LSYLSASFVAHHLNFFMESDLEGVPSHVRALIAKLAHRSGTLADYNINLVTDDRTRVLDLSNCVHVTDISCKMVASHCRSLYMLDLTNCPGVTNHGLKTISELNGSLHAISLKYCSITDKGLKHLKALPNLHKLALSSRLLSDRGLSMFAAYTPHLSYLSLSHCVLLSDEGLSRCTQSLPNLVGLNLKGCSRLTYNCVRALDQNCSKLTSLNVSRCHGVSDAFISVLSMSRIGRQLRNLKLNYTKITDVAMFFIAQNCRALQKLSIAHCVYVTQRGLTHLTARSRHLKRIRLAHCIIVRKSTASHGSGSAASSAASSMHSSVVSSPRTRPGPADRPTSNRGRSPAGAAGTAAAAGSLLSVPERPRAQATHGRLRQEYSSDDDDDRGISDTEEADALSVMRNARFSVRHLPSSSAEGDLEDDDMGYENENDPDDDANDHEFGPPTDSRRSRLRRHHLRLQAPATPGSLAEEHDDMESVGGATSVTADMEEDGFGDEDDEDRHHGDVAVLAELEEQDDGEEDMVDDVDSD